MGAAVGLKGFAAAILGGLGSIPGAIAGGLVPGFYVGGFWNAFFGGIIVSIVSYLLSLFFKASDGHYYLITHHATLKQGGTGMKTVPGRVVE